MSEFLKKLNALLEEHAHEANSTSVLIVATEISLAGEPLGTVSKLSAAPMNALGLIDYSQNHLEELRESVYSNLKNQETREEKGNINSGGGSGLPPEIESHIHQMVFNAMLDKMPEPLRDVIKPYAEAIRKAIENDDQESLDAIKKKIMEELKKGGDPGDFNIDDFTGGMF